MLVFSFGLFHLPDIQNDGFYPYFRLILRKETNGIQSISLNARNGRSQLWHVVGRFYPVRPIPCVIS